MASLRPTPKAPFFLLIAALAVFGASSARLGELQPFVGSPTPFSLPTPLPPAIESAAVLYDLSTGTFLFTKGAHRPLSPGGLTKIATALVVLERVDLAADVQVSKEAAHAPGYNLPLEVGQLIPVEQLLRALLLLPGTDAAIALAQHAMGSLSGFQSEMGAVARRLGAERSRFENPHGLDDEGHVSTAYDIALLAAAAWKHEAFREIVGTTRTKLELGGGRTSEVRNVNSFLWRYPGATGIQSAYSPRSGYSLVGTASRGDVQLLVVVMGASSPEARFHDAAALLDFGFAHYPSLLASPLEERVRYQVKDGDTLIGIARSFDVPVSAIRRINPELNSDRIVAGDLLWVPR